MDNQTNLYTYAATAVLRAISRGNRKHIENMGIDPDLHSQLCDLSVIESERIYKKAEKLFSIQANVDELKNELISIKRERNYSRELDTYILHHATSRMMNKFFGMHPSEFSFRRRVLGMSGEGNQRPAYCEGQQGVAVWNSWIKHEDREERERYLIVAEETNIPLSNIYITIERDKDVLNKEM